MPGIGCIPINLPKAKGDHLNLIGITAFLMGSSKSNGCPFTAWSGSAKFSISAGYSTGNKIRLITKRE
ncbi:MAG: hypothetical protein P8M30_14635 [Planctomycetaceae bacterium]|nr:hypothetical protein [Planctomycetaceae bacterium]